MGLRIFHIENMEVSTLTHQIDFTTILVFILIFIITNNIVTNLRRLPGPWAWPLVGNLPNLMGYKKSFDPPLHLRQKYGNIVGLKVGPLGLVYICGHKALTDVFQKKTELTKYRPNWMYLATRLTGKTGIVWSNGDLNHHIRKFSLSALRDFGLGKTSLEDKILEEAHVLSDSLAKSKGLPVALDTLLPKAVSNVISSIVFGSRFDYNDEDFESLLQRLDYIVVNSNYKLLENYLPILEKILPNSKVRKIVKTRNDFNDYIRKEINLHKKSFDRGNIRDFIDLFIDQETNESEDALTDEDLFQTIFDLYVAGSETTATSLMWIFLFMIKYPEVQTRCREDIKKVVGDKNVTFKDRAKLPYIAATVNEIMRLKTIAPLGIPRTTMEDIQIDGITIPKRSTMVEVLISAHYDTDYWENPEEFHPERFLDENNSIIRREAFYPFGLGKRVCLAKQLAETEMFLFFATLLQRFRFENAQPEVPLDMDGISPGVTYSPSPYKVLLQKL